MNNLELLIETLVKEEIQQQVLEEGIFQSLSKGLKLAGKLAYLQATKGPEAVSEELINNLSTFIEKLKTTKMSFALQDTLQDLEEEVEKIKIKKQRARDERGRFKSEAMTRI